MNEQMVKSNPTEAAVAAILDSEQAKTADGVLVSVTTGYKIATVEDRQQASDTLAILRRSARDAEAKLTDALRKPKAWLAALSAKVKESVTRWESGAHTVEREMRRWDAEAERQRKLAEAEAQRQANLAAQAAAAEAATRTDEEEALPAPQVTIPQAQNTVRGAVGRDSKTRRLEALEIVDAVAAAQSWPHLLTLDKAGAKAEFDVLLRRGTAEAPPDFDDTRPSDGQGVVVGGIRFVTRVGYTSGRV